MIERALTEDLSATFVALDRMLARHQEAEAYDLGRNRLAFVHIQLELLYAELRALRLLVTLLQTLGEAESEVRFRQQSLNTLRECQPAVLRTPGQAIIQGDVELLKIVEYLSTAVALVRERRLVIGRKLAQFLEEHLTAESRCDADDNSQTLIHSYNPLLAALKEERSAEDLLVLLKAS